MDMYSNGHVEWPWAQMRAVNEMSTESELEIIHYFWIDLSASYL